MPISSHPITTSHKIILIKPFLITPPLPLHQLPIPSLPPLLLLPPFPHNLLLFLLLLLSLPSLLGALTGQVCFFCCGELVGRGDGAGFLEAVYDVVCAGGDEDFFGLRKGSLVKGAA